jgi:hypothetical protein
MAVQGSTGSPMDTLGQIKSMVDTGHAISGSGNQPGTPSADGTPPADGEQPPAEDAGGGGPSGMGPGALLGQASASTKGLQTGAANTVSGMQGATVASANDTSLAHNITSGIGKNEAPGPQQGPTPTGAAGSTVDASNESNV